MPRRAIPPPPGRPSQPAPAGLDLEPDEPAFVLRASDLMASETLLEWCRLAQRFGVSTTRIREAERCARAMERWRLKNGR